MTKKERINSSTKNLWGWLSNYYVYLSKDSKLLKNTNKQINRIIIAQINQLNYYHQNFILKITKMKSINWRTTICKARSLLCDESIVLSASFHALLLCFSIKMLSLLLWVLTGDQLLARKNWHGLNGDLVKYSKYSFNLENQLE